MSYGEEIALEAMKKELSRLNKAADKAKREVDEYVSSGSDMIAILTEFKAIVDSKEHGQHILDKLKDLQRRRDRINRVMKKDLLTLTDKAAEVDSKRHSLAGEISTLEFRLERQKRSS